MTITPLPDFSFAAPVIDNIFGGRAYYVETPKFNELSMCLFQRKNTYIIVDFAVLRVKKT